jgi:hypothetical protein
MALRADMKPAIFPARLRYLSVFMATWGFVNEWPLRLKKIHLAFNGFLEIYLLYLIGSDVYNSTALKNKFLTV